MKITIFNTPVLSFIFHVLARIVMRLAGWRVDGKLPDIPKYILIGAPHTSNWDFVLFLGVVFALRANVRFMGKAELFRFPVGWFFRYCGGIPVDRKKSTGLVEQMVKICNESDRFILTITPEGTRHHVTEWKRGFYHIAKTAGIPIVMAQVDGKRKTVHILKDAFHPTEDMEADMRAIKGSFEGIVGIKPRRKYITLER
ncbi:MAG: lysophospholipid acyltransferase family protein [Anaerolineales bacterium]|nr:lysophospholipid acyltransferase family protein [Anaerolineales bacterium]NUQ84599.1 lysophospholipid acyltransferase family protein [Anaerolineales bacterium]